MFETFPPHLPCFLLSLSFKRNNHAFCGKKNVANSKQKPNRSEKEAAPTTTTYIKPISTKLTRRTPSSKHAIATVLLYLPHVFPSWMHLCSHTGVRAWEPFHGTGNLGFPEKVPRQLLITWASAERSGSREKGSARDWGPWSKWLAITFQLGYGLWTLWAMKEEG